VLEEEGVPRGFCGMCEKCGKLGHLRHHPGSVSYTGVWCDYHYRLLTTFHYKTVTGCTLRLMVAVAGLVGWAVWRVWHAW